MIILIEINHFKINGTVVTEIGILRLPIKTVCYALKYY